MSRIAEKNKKELAIDIVKSVLQWTVVTALAFLYWMAMLLLASLFLLNVWHVKFETILNISIILTVLTSLGYFGVICYRKFK